MAPSHISGQFGRNALRTVILTGKRVGEVLQLDWSQIDLEQGVLRIPWEQMKGRLPKRMKQRAGDEGQQRSRQEDEFYVEPLTSALREVLAEMQALGSRTGPVFAYEEDGVLRKLTRQKLSAISRELGLPGTSHGWRKTVRTWMSGLGDDKPDFEVAEMVLAHKVGTPISQLYNKEFFLPARRALQERWADFLRMGARSYPRRETTAG